MAGINLTVLLGVGTDFEGFPDRLRGVAAQARLSNKFEIEACPRVPSRYFINGTVPALRGVLNAMDEVEAVIAGNSSPREILAMA
ncbi:MAG: hypothetical protein GC136_09315 [Alphaproteobacteria bacterium]|nr:hypothetical protein [Alphaproteobacteria bacterium]